ncbi:MAG: hypothetical protein D6674_07755, partial [Acidobacteria bacterium]
MSTIRRLKDRLKERKNYKAFLLKLIPFLIIALLVGIFYKPYMDHINSMKESYRDKKELYKKYREKADGLDKLKEEEKVLNASMEKLLRICKKGGEEDKAMSQFHQSVVSQISSFTLTLNVEQPSKESHGQVDLFLLKISGMVTDLKPFLLFLEKAESSE